MTEDDAFLSRWSKRKSQARAGAPAAEEPQEADPAQLATAASAPVPATPRDEPLPAIESLTPESDFTPFMKPGVDAGTQREALKTLFRDPYFDVIDMLDVYKDDYSKPDPLPDGWLEKLNQMARLGSYVEKPEKEAAASAVPAVPPPDAADEKPLLEQGNAIPISTDSSDTADGPIPGPAVRE